MDHSAELQAAYDELHHALMELETLDEQIKALVAGHWATRKELQRRVRDACRDINHLLYEESPNYEEGTMETISRETGEVKSTRPLTADEHQLHLAEIDPDTPRPQPKGPPEVEAELDELERRRIGGKGR